MDFRKSESGFGVGLSTEKLFYWPHLGKLQMSGPYPVSCHNTPIPGYQLTDCACDENCIYLPAPDSKDGVGDASLQGRKTAVGIRSQSPIASRKTMDGEGPLKALDE
ncbi:MAG TPA: hypothetical protein DDW65_04200 [Firmicutes bacterium]|jgi:hypothetical protein|nr:hypothetical protein [Bacillota bacterium]